MSISELQRAKKVVSDNPGLVHFAVRLVYSVLNLPIREVRIFFYGRTVVNPAHLIFFWLAEMTFGLVLASYSLPELIVKLTFLHPTVDLLNSVL